MEFDQNVPPLARQSRGNYYVYLTSQGMPHRQAYDMAIQQFGPPKSPKELADDKAKAEQIGGLAQAAGVIGGAYGASKIGGLFGSGAAASGATSAGAAGTGAVTLTGGGVATIPAGAAVPAGYTAIGTSASGATMVAPTSMAGTTTTGASTLGSIGSVALPVAVGAAIINNAWETGMKDIVRGRGDRADWTNQLANMTGVGAVANIGLRLLGKRSIGAMMKSGKSEAQALRDDFRSKLKQTGVADDNYHVTLADGTKFNIGLDGKTKYENVGENIDGKKTRNAWDVDFSNPLAKYASDKIDPMIRSIYGEDAVKAGIKPEQYTGMLVNAVTSNAKSNEDIERNIQTVLGKSDFAKQAGVGVTPPPPAKAPKGQVVRVSPGMYVNDKGHVGPAKTVRESLQANYNKGKSKGRK